MGVCGVSQYFPWIVEKGPTAKLCSSLSSSESSSRPIACVPPGWRICFVHCHNCRFTDFKCSSFQVSGAGLSRNSSCWAGNPAALVKWLSSKRSDLYRSRHFKNCIEFSTGVLDIPSFFLMWPLGCKQGVLIGFWVDTSLLFSYLNSLIISAKRRKWFNRHSNRCSNTRFMSSSRIEFWRSDNNSLILSKHRLLSVDSSVACAFLYSDEDSQLSGAADYRVLIESRYVCQDTWPLDQDSELHTR